MLLFGATTVSWNFPTPIMLKTRKMLITYAVMYISADS